MIDTNDKATQPLPLDEQPMKRKRGRPATGTAMTPAEKQRAYRERQKRLRDQNSEQAKGEYSAERFEELRLITVEISERCKAAEARVAELQKELELRDRKAKKSNVTELEAPGKGVWTVQFKCKGERSWSDCDPLLDLDGKAHTFERMKENVRMNMKAAPTCAWRAVRNDGLVYDPKAVK